MNEHFRQLIHHISKGDTTLVESFFRRKGGRKYLKHLTLILIHTLPQHFEQKEESYRGFVEVLDLMEQRIQRKNEGEDILGKVFESSEP